MLFSLLLAPCLSWAAALGEITVETVLNEPFFAKVEIVGADQLPAEWSVSLADEQGYEELGVRRTRYVDRMQATVVQAANRPPVVYLEGRQPLTELILDLVVVMVTNGDRQVRHYALLIDFPALAAPAAAPAQPAAPEPAPVQSLPRRPIPAPPKPRPIAAIPLDSSDEIYRVQSGDSLYTIAKRVAAGRTMDLNDVMDALFALNPDAFIRGDINLLKAGANLQLPDLGAMPMAAAPSTSPSSVDRSISQGGRTAPASPAQPGASAAAIDEPRVELRGAPDTDTIVDNLNNWLEADDQRTVERMGEVRRDLAFAAAEIETYRKENELLRSQVDDLEERVVEMERLLTLQANMISTFETDEEPPANEPAAEQPVAQQPVVEEPPAEEAAPPPGSIPDVAPESVAVDAAEPDDEEIDWQWLVFPGGAALLLIGFGAVVFLRTMREDRRRRKSAQDLTSRLRESKENRAILPDDL